MYNGIGLTTPRGSGTNGYVQRNLSFVRHKSERADYARIDKIKPDVQKKPNLEILEHQRKRQIEVQIAQWVDENKFVEQGYDSYTNCISLYQGERVYIHNTNTLIVSRRYT